MTQDEGKQHVVLCEGFDDRSFWSGWLKYLGCTDPSEGGRRLVKDVRGRLVVGGRYLFRTPAGSSVIVQPFYGRANARKAAADYLRGQARRPNRLVLNLDSDANAGSEDTTQEAIRQIFGNLIEDQSDGGARPNGTQVFPVVWECDDPDPTPGVPPKQTLERLVTASIRAAYPDRGPVVDRWLAAEPRGESTSHKSYSYSYLAKWYAEHGADDFFRDVWRHENVVRELQQRLDRANVWQTVKSLAND